MTERFKSAHAFTAKWEGGLSNHKNDPGGITNHGISLRWLKQLANQAEQDCRKQLATCDGSNSWDNPYDFNEDNIIDGEDIKACTKEQAARLMCNNFWEPLHCDNLPLPLGTVLYDSAVNMGAPRATRILQEACNVVGEAHLDEFEALKVDGICGAKTVKLCAALKDFGLDYYTARLAVRQRINFYVNLTRSDDKFSVFLEGWKNRCQGMLEHLALLEREA